MREVQRQRRQRQRAASVEAGLRRPLRDTLRLMNWHCPICKKPTDAETYPDFPFCSERCRLLDLGNWAAERYVVSEPAVDEPASEKPDPDEPRN